MGVLLVTSNHAKGSGNVSCSITVSGNNKLVIIGGLTTGDIGDPSYTCTFGGASPTGTIFNTFTSSAYRSYMYYWLNPANGDTTAAIKSSSSRTWLCASCWQGVEQSSPIRTLKSGNALGLTGIDCSIGDMLVDLLTSKVDKSTATVDSTCTVLGKDYLYSGSGYGNGNMSYKTAQSISESITWSNMASILVHNAISIIPAKEEIGGSVAMLSDYGIL